MGNRQNIFISYRREDSKEFASHLHTQLENDYDVFLDTEDGIPYGEKFLPVIIKNIEKADIFLMVISKNSCEEFKRIEGRDDYVVKEVEHAQKVGSKIIPLLIDGVTIPDCFPKSIAFVSGLNSLNLEKNFLSTFEN